MRHEGYCVILSVYLIRIIQKKNTKLSAIQRGDL